VSSGVEPVRASLITYKHNTGSLFLREEGRYVIILDNTKYGQTAPPDDQKEDVAEIEYSISRKYYD
jgi:hypothetical protein